MGMEYRQLTGSIRAQMKDELERDVANRRLYLSPRLTGLGSSQWQGLLGTAVDQYDDQWLAGQIASNNLISPWYHRTTRSKTHRVKLGFNAIESLCEGEFNRFYIRGVCAEALRKGKAYVTVYRAKDVWAPRPESIRLVGTRIAPGELLADLRNNIGRATDHGIPSGPNSGLSVYY